MLYGAHDLRNWEVATEINGQWVVARPMWVSWGRWKHAWWVLTGRCDAVWWPEDGNPYWGSLPKRGWRMTDMAEYVTAAMHAAKLHGLKAEHYDTKTHCTIYPHAHLPMTVHQLIGILSQLPDFWVVGFDFLNIELGASEPFVAFCSSLKRGVEEKR